jgi:hypothetical protein
MRGWRIEMLYRMIALGVGMLLAVAAVEARAQEDEHRYVGVKKCRSCHKKELMGDQYGVWKEAQHSKAVETLKGDEAVKIAKEKGIAGPPHEAEECLKCHATAYGLEASQMKYDLKISDGVQCESCHGAGADYRKKKTMSDHDKSVAKGLKDPGENEEICTTCHNDDSPSWDTTKYELADGTTVAFDFEQAKKEIEHPIPEDVKGKYLEIEKKQKAERRARGEDVEDDEDEDDEEEED